MKKRFKMPMNLQFFAEPAGGEGSGSGEQGQQSPPAPTPPAQPPAIDYDKIQQMLTGTLAAKEDTALKAYFKQQGLSQQEAEKAMASFKQQKAANQPDVGVMQTQIANAQKEAVRANIESAATMAAVSLGIDAKTIPYVIKMADLSQAADQDGKINEETIKAALNKVLEDIPALKKQEAAPSGFRPVTVGADSNQQQPPASTQPQIPTKRWNRWNN